MKDRLEERLRRLNIGRPDPVLRERVFEAVEAELAEGREPPMWRTWLAGWRVEALLSVGIAAAVVLLQFNPFPTDRSAPVPRVDRAMVDTMVEELQLDQDLEAHFRARLQLSRKTLAAMRRAGHDHRSFNIDAF